MLQRGCLGARNSYPIVYAARHARRQHDCDARGHRCVAAVTRDLYGLASNLHWMHQPRLVDSRHGSRFAPPGHDPSTEPIHATHSLSNIADTGSTSKATFASISAVFGATPDMNCAERGGSACLTARRRALALARRADDTPSEDLPVRRLQVHDKHAWMLQAPLRQRRSASRDRGRTPA